MFTRYRSFPMKIVNNPNMKTIKDKKLVVGADFAG